MHKEAGRPWPVILKTHRFFFHQIHSKFPRNPSPTRAPKLAGCDGRDEWSMRDVSKVLNHNRERSEATPFRFRSISTSLVTLAKVVTQQLQVAKWLLLLFYRQLSCYTYYYRPLQAKKLVLYDFFLLNPTRGIKSLHTKKKSTGVFFHFFHSRLTLPGISDLCSSCFGGHLQNGLRRCLCRPTNFVGI